eukprot:COSAG02_NODE_5082_length_4655_cov_2.260097_4_plen_70_part_00
MARDALAPASGNTRTKRAAASKAEAAMQEPDEGRDVQYMSLDEHAAYSKKEKSGTSQRCSRVRCPKVSL